MAAGQHSSHQLLHHSMNTSGQQHQQPPVTQRQVQGAYPDTAIPGSGVPQQAVPENLKSKSEYGYPPSEPSSMHLDSRPKRTAFSKRLTPHYVQEHPGFKRNKLTLLSMGIAVVLVANVTFLGFLTPPRPPPVPLLYFDLPQNHQVDAVAENGFINMLFNKTLGRFPNGTLDGASLDYSKLSLDEYTSLYTTINQPDFCDYNISTAFLVFNGFAFSFSIATLFLVAVVPVIIRRHHWDAYLARVGAIYMSITLLFFVVAFILAGFVTAGVGLPSPQDCGSDTLGLGLDAILSGKLPNKTGDVVSAAAYATLGMICFLIIIVAVLALKDTALTHRPPEEELMREPSKETTMS